MKITKVWTNSENVYIKISSFNNINITKIIGEEYKSEKLSDESINQFLFLSKRKSAKSKTNEPLNCKPKKQI